jgi:putative lipoic acid-binding regulatory protein
MESHGREFDLALFPSPPPHIRLMNNLPSVELLEQMHAFPCQFTFKIIGKTEDGFVARALAIVREQLAVEVDPPFRVRHTAGGRHVSLTVEPEVQNAWEVLGVYQAVQSLPGLVCQF